MDTTATEAMTRALTKAVTLFFDTEEQAKAFRLECYRQRSALRLVDKREFDGLTFKVTSNTLTIVAKATVNGIV